MIGELSRRRSSDLRSQGRLGPRAIRRTRQVATTRNGEMLSQRAAAPGVARVARAGQERLADWLQSSVLVQLVLAMGFVALAALLYLGQASQVSVLEVNISDLQSRQVQLNADYASLEANATSLQSLQRVEHLATTQLHMTRPDLSTAVWVQPVLPRIVPLRPLNADTLAAQRASEPLAWIRHVVGLVQSSL